MTTEPTTITIEPINPDDVGTRLAIVERDASLPEDSAVALRGQFAGFFTDIVEWRDKAALVTKPEDKTHQKIAREVRLGLRGVRCGVENTRKALKAESLARGKAIDGFANVLKYLCEPIEEKLLAVEQFAERQEAARIAELVELRTQALAMTGGDPAAYNLAVMDERTFDIILDTAKKAKEAREEAARQAEAERVAREQADRIAREKAEREAAQLREAARLREIEIQKERAAREAVERIQREAAERERKESEKKQRAAEAKAAKECAEVEAAMRKEREAADKAKAELAASKAREAQRLAAEKAEREQVERDIQDALDKAARAPDKEKIIAFADEIESLAFPMPTTNAGAEVMESIVSERAKFTRWIRQQAEGM